MSAASLPVEAYGTALASLPAMGPRRLLGLLRRWSPEECWDRVIHGRAGLDPSTLWRDAARGVDPAAAWEATLAAGVGVAVFGTPSYPSLLADDHQPPGVLFHKGRLGALDGRRVAIVGTRRATHYGLDIAHELGRELSSAGVRVVSGLALGVDGAAHLGSLEASASGPPIGVVASGLNVAYPRSHSRLWAAVGEQGLLVSEAPLGVRPEKWRFPVRNRVIAAMAEVVVVVESHVRGGSRHTVEAAAARGLGVMAVPGSVRSPASAYCNGLIADGCAPVRDATDVLVALGLSSATSRPAGTGAVTNSRPPPPGTDGVVLEALGWEPASFEEVVVRASVSPVEASLALAHLERDGWINSTGGWWRRLVAP